MIEEQDASNNGQTIQGLDSQPLTKQLIWERKLLDFTLRNNLLNTRLGRRVVPFMSFGIDRLEDLLQQGEDFQVVACPGERLEPLANDMFDSSLQAKAHEQQVCELMAGGRIVSYLNETELPEALKYIYRSARTAIEENGANSLFLTLGMLRWYETPRSEQARYAPLLLLPVDIVRRAGNNFVIRKRDEEIIPNITLLELLKQNFNIRIDKLKSLPKDDSGIDVRQVFTTVRQAVADMERWTVVEESLLGLFSFNKFVMWNDIHTNADKLEESPVIAALTGKPQPQADTGADDESTIDAREIDKTCAPMDFAIPLDVDSSQMEAVVESGRGRSFILHGPPGTGKSQTITNMIANALFQGKRVLFVAEKMAALSVVQSRLEKVGLAPFCLELHSNKVTKKHFLEQMDKVLNVKKIKSPTAFGRTSDELFAERRELIAYMEALHRRSANGLSLYDCISEYLRIDGPEEQELTTPREQLTADFIAQCRVWADELEAIVQLTGSPAGHPLAGLELKDNKIATLDELKDTLTAINRLMPQYRQQQHALCDISPFHLTTEGDTQWLEHLAACLSNCEMLTPPLVSLGDDDTTHQAMKQLTQLGHDCEQLMTKLSSRYDPSVVTIDAAAERRRWNEIQAKWWLPRWWGKRGFLKQLRQYGAVTDEDVPQLLETVDTYRQKRSRIDNSSEQLSHYFGVLATQGQEEWQRIDGLLATVPQLTALLSDYARSHGQRYADTLKLFIDSFDGQWKVFQRDFINRANSLTATYHSLTAQTEHLNTLTVNQSSFDEVADNASRWQAHSAAIKDWYHWTDMKQTLLAAGLQPVVAAMEQQAVAPAAAMNAFLKGAYHQLIALAIDDNPQLRKFNGQLFQQQIEKYKQNTRRFQELSKEELYSRLAARVPSAAMATADGSEVSILKRNIANGGRGNSIRSIIDNIPTLLPRLCPCMLMSPLSVAQFLDLSTEKFDIVIFDEASQMPTSEAVGAIARGRSLIVVGDSKQMPPTSFFTVSQVDEDEADLDDLESILDDCRTLSMHEYYLSWHYRSKHESLIAFSNSQYYDNKLLTFPSVDDRDVKVRLIPVNGKYDKGRTRSNPEEAQAITDEVMRRLQDPELSRLSIGIVSFSKVQQNLIEDILSEELDKHPVLKAIAYNEHEPIFIKNLENVQGDERDVILFSVGYGPDHTGRVTMNFGPLNNSGGERRLNVAVSRARYEMMVFSTLKASDIDLRRSNAKGVEGLKAFLEYAESGLLPTTAADSGNEKSVLVDEISKAVTALGYEVTPAVGRSSFKIDLAVSARRSADDSTPSPYILGILCDGRNYYETKTTRDREIVQPSVLHALHWHIMRVYSIDWYENRERVLARIQEELKQAEEGQPRQTKPQQATPDYTFSVDTIKPLSVVTESLRHERKRKYFENERIKMEVDKSNYKCSAPYNQMVVSRILEIEQPVTGSYLCKRMAKIFGFGHVGGNIRTAVDMLKTKFYCQTMLNGDTCFWLDRASANEYKYYRAPSPRAIQEIPDIEIKNAISEVITEEFSLPRAKIASLTARKLGYATTGSKISEVILAVLSLMEQEAIVKTSGDMVTMA